MRNFLPGSSEAKSSPGWGKLTLTINIHQQSSFPFHEQHPWTWATDLHTAKDVKERVSAASLVSTVFLWHSDCCGYALRMKYLFYLLYPFRVYEGSAYLWISESLQSQNIQILFYSMQTDLSIVPFVSAAHSLSLETLSLKTIHGSIHFRYSALWIWPSFPFFFPPSSSSCYSFSDVSIVFLLPPTSYPSWHAP